MQESEDENDENAAPSEESKV